MSDERLQKLMARAGIASRRECEEDIKQKRVTVNGKTASLGDKADPGKDEIRFDGTLLKMPAAFDYVMLNKPRGVISDEDVGGNWPAAREMIPLEGHYYPVGRLDVPSEGLLLFTNDGDLAHKLTHPRYEHEKVYHVLVVGTPSEDALQRWRAGVFIEGQKTLPATVRVLRKTSDGTWLEITMREGRKRQIRKVAALLDMHIQQLIRVKLGPLELGNLPSGAWRRLTEEEVARLKDVREKRARPRKQGARKQAPKPGGGRNKQNTTRGRSNSGKTRRGDRRSPPK